MDADEDHHYEAEDGRKPSQQADIQNILRTGIVDQ
jgi:hypothetical protein